ncbi:hypothetical protein MED01_002346 [Micromonospora sp. MED01]|uniref:hypothetical protein n=1 Tax=Micromonospora alfalfae TaxID=2911212 RepID=UPI001EE9364E|nr:hypothetical protein [Micromonospora alfalfae]MCG5464181.1 hypothetical protein [Micromonospora alfalfae]
MAADTTTTWRDRAPIMLQTDADPDGQPCATPVDRRWLWRLESALAISARSGSVLGDLSRDLSQYLNESCEHHWRVYDADPGDDIASHRQCLWCSFPEWKNADGSYSADVTA